MADAGDVAGGVGEGLAQALPNLLQAARDERNQRNYEQNFALQKPMMEAQTQTAQSQAALSQDAVRKMEQQKELDKKLDTPKPMEQVMKSHPIMEYLAREYAPIAGWDQNKTEITPREMQEGMKYMKENPQVALKAATAFHQDTLGKVKDYDAAIEKYQEELKELTVDAGDSVLNKSKIEKVQEKLNEAQKAKQPLDKNRIESSQMITQLKRQQSLMELGKNPNDDMLYLGAQSSDPVIAEQYKKAIEQKQRDKMAVEKAKKDANTDVGDVSSMVESVIAGNSNITDIKNTRGKAISNEVMKGIQKQYPKFNFLYSEANKKYIQSAVNARIIGAVDASLPRVNMLADQAENLKNKDIPAINAVMKQILTQTGSPVYTNFESNRNAIVQEVNTALSGSSQSSDMRVQIELENLKSSRSPAQLLGAISNLREALIARKDASQQYIYPMEVVRGEITQKEWKDQMDKKYRGKYGVASSSQVQSNKVPSDMDAFWK
jgi:hypothetical protein